MEKNIGIIIQARINSTRLPKKVIKKIEGKTVLEHVISRLKMVKKNSLIILATTDKKEDDILERIAKTQKIAVYRGSELDVLDRFYRAAKLLNIGHIVRITADCPLIDPEIVEKTIDFYQKGKYDYVSNSHPPTFPDGMDVEVFSFRALKKCWEEAKLPEEREHVTFYISKNLDIFKTGNYSAKNKDLRDWRLTIDQEEDMVLIKKIYKELYKKNKIFSLREITSLLKKHPDFLRINSKVISHPLSRWEKTKKIN